MKLIYCPKCHHVVKIGFFRSVTYCECEYSFGHYLKDKVHVVYGGSAIPLRFGDSTLAKAIESQPDDGFGERFEAVVIPKSCPTFSREE